MCEVVYVLRAFNARPLRAQNKRAATNHKLNPPTHHPTADADAVAASPVGGAGGSSHASTAAAHGGGRSAWGGGTPGSGVNAGAAGRVWNSLARVSGAPTLVGPASLGGGAPSPCGDGGSVSGRGTSHGGGGGGGRTSAASNSKHARSPSSRNAFTGPVCVEEQRDEVHTGTLGPSSDADAGGVGSGLSSQAAAASPSDLVLGSGALLTRYAAMTHSSSMVMGMAGGPVDPAGGSSAAVSASHTSSDNRVLAPVRRSAGGSTTSTVRGGAPHVGSGGSVGSRGGGGGIYSVIGAGGSRAGGSGGSGGSRGSRGGSGKSPGEASSGESRLTLPHALAPMGASLVSDATLSLDIGAAGAAAGTGTPARDSRSGGRLGGSAMVAAAGVTVSVPTSRLAPGMLMEAWVVEHDEAGEDAAAAAAAAGGSASGGDGAALAVMRQQAGVVASAQRALAVVPSMTSVSAPHAKSGVSASSPLSSVGSPLSSALPSVRSGAAAVSGGLATTTGGSGGGGGGGSGGGSGSGIGSDTGRGMHDDVVVVTSDDAGRLPVGASGACSSPLAAAAATTLHSSTSPSSRRLSRSALGTLPVLAPPGTLSALAAAMAKADAIVSDIRMRGLTADLIPPDVALDYFYADQEVQRLRASAVAARGSPPMVAASDTGSP